MAAGTTVKRIRAPGLPIWSDAVLGALVSWRLGEAQYCLQRLYDDNRDRLVYRRTRHVAMPDPEAFTTALSRVIALFPEPLLQLARFGVQEYIVVTLLVRVS